MTYSEFPSNCDYANHMPRDFGQARLQEWNEFPEPDFSAGTRSGALLDAAWTVGEAGLSKQGMQFLQRIRRGLEEGMRRLHLLETERQKYAAFESLLERMPTALMLIGADGGVMFWNASARRRCQRWNEGLSNPVMRLQDRVRMLIEGAPVPPSNESAQRVVHSIPHPALASLSVRVVIERKSAGLHATPCYEVELLDGNEGGEADAASGLPCAEERQAAMLELLAPRERRVAMMVADGMRNEEIAQKLCRSRRTIECQVASIYRRLEVSNRVQLSRLLAA